MFALEGYVAARRGRTTGWTNSLVVGVFAEIFVAGELNHDEISQMLAEITKDPAAHWVALVQLICTIPAALIGGIVWQGTNRSREDDS